MLYCQKRVLFHGICFVLLNTCESMKYTKSLFIQAEASEKNSNLCNLTMKKCSKTISFWKEKKTKNRFKLVSLCPNAIIWDGFKVKHYFLMITPKTKNTFRTHLWGIIAAIGKMNIEHPLTMWFQTSNRHEHWT